MRYCIAYIANEEVQAYFRDLTGRLSAKFGIANLSKRIPAHITLKYPFEMDDTTQIESRIEAVALAITSVYPSVSFEIGGLSRFKEDSKTIYMKISGDLLFKETVTNCILNLGNVDEEQKFEIENRVFHMSIARHLDTETSDKIFKYLTEENSPWSKVFEAKFDNISLMEFKDETWSIKKMFKI